MSETKVRLGGMALANGVLVHGPTAWACAVRTDDGELKVVARRKRFSGAKIESPLLRGPDVAAYHGAEHISIGTYEHGKRAEREHERCGSHLLGPLLATTALANTLASHAPVHLRTAARVGGQLAAVAASTEIFGWMVRNPDKPLARALAKPGHELQHRIATAEPTPEQIEVAEAALAACLELERT
jgi:uncharacterized protein YqhQ